MDEVVYRMQLGDGRGWQISAEEELRLWTEKFATIMELKACKPTGYPKLIFIRKKPKNGQTAEPPYEGKENFAGELGKNGWRVQEIYNVRFWSKSDLTDIVCELGSDNKFLDLVMMRHSLYPIYQGVLDFEGLPFHAGLIEREGKGVLLAAQRNTGKSTCCLRVPKPWHALCDEETIIVRNDQKKYLAHPFPTWSNKFMKHSEKTWNVERHVSLAAVFFLEQAPVDAAIPLGQGEAAVSIYQSAMQVLYRYWHNLDSSELRVRNKDLFANSCKLTKTVPTFKLRVSLRGRFWEEIERVLF
jgi:SynChlorMet cassette protein ScmC